MQRCPKGSFKWRNLNLNLIFLQIYNIHSVETTKITKKKKKYSKLIIFLILLKSHKISFNKQSGYQEFQTELYITGIQIIQQSAYVIGPELCYCPLWSQNVCMGAVFLSCTCTCIFVLLSLLLFGCQFHRALVSIFGY